MYMEGMREREARYCVPRKKTKFKKEVGELGAEVGLTQVLEAGEEGPQMLIGSSEA